MLQRWKQLCITHSNKHILFLIESCVLFLLYLYFLRWQSVGCDTGHHCYDFEFEIKSELSQYTFYCLVMNDGCLFSPQADGNN